MKLTGEQIRSIDAGETVTVSLDDRLCVVVRKDVYERLLSHGSAGLSPETVGARVHDAMALYDADDPLLDSYQEGNE